MDMNSVMDIVHATEQKMSSKYGVFNRKYSNTSVYEIVESYYFNEDEKKLALEKAKAIKPIRGGFVEVRENSSGSFSDGTILWRSDKKIDVVEKEDLDQEPISKGKKLNMPADGSELKDEEPKPKDIPHGKVDGIKNIKAPNESVKLDEKISPQVKATKEIAKALKRAVTIVVPVIKKYEELGSTDSEAGESVAEIFMNCLRDGDTSYLDDMNLEEDNPFSLYDDEDMDEGKKVPGKRDGTGPHKRSAQRSISKKGKRKEAGEKCPNESKVKSTLEKLGYQVEKVEGKDLFKIKKEGKLPLDTDDEATKIKKMVEDKKE